jgi:ribosomal protein L19
MTCPGGIHSFLIRASKLLNELKNEEFSKLKSGRKWPQIRAGDAIEIKV